MRIPSRTHSKRRLTALYPALGFVILWLLTMPLLAGAQSNDHGEHMQSMPDMHMPVKPADKESQPKEKTAAASSVSKSACREQSLKAAKAGEPVSSQCPQKRQESGKEESAAPVGQLDHSQVEGMDHSQMEGMDHSQIEGVDHSQMEGKDHSQMEGMDHSQMQGMDMQGGSAPADARDPDYSDGIRHESMRGMDMDDDANHLYVLFDNLEYRHGSDDNAQAVAAQAWYGGDHNKLWLKLDGERTDGRLGPVRTEVLWSHAIAAFWDAQAGLRHDQGDGPTRDWAAIGVQGLAPYWFELEATAYLGQSGRTALRLEAEYELLFTQRLILQPDIEVNLYGKNDPQRGIGAGLSDVEVGLRLRYEITRKFAPYVGVVWSRKFGATADYARAAGKGAQETQLIAGIRIWF